MTQFKGAVFEAVVGGEGVVCALAAEVPLDVTVGWDMVATPAAVGRAAVAI